ncbi:MAG: orotidine-5'-phosphate decarboxylase [Candidatus Bathyarchaeia archaeon]
MDNFADRLIDAVKRKGNPCVVGLDPRVDQMPNFITDALTEKSPESVRQAIAHFHRTVLDVAAQLVPAVKPQIAFYEQYGLGGILAFMDTIQMAKERGLIVIVDAKRNDVAATAEAYANAFLGRTRLPWGDEPVFDADCVTISPFLGRDSLNPFLKACSKYGKGVFILVKTSNPGSRDLQDVKEAESGQPIYVRLARTVAELGQEMIGKNGYSSVGAVVGATFPEQAKELRQLMPRSIILVPGYGSQGGTAQDAAKCFNPDGLGAVVNASRSITYTFQTPNISEKEYAHLVRNNVEKMAAELNTAIRRHAGMK